MNPSPHQPAVSAQPASAATVSAKPKVKKVILAIHGIGDQSRNETIQSVVARFCAYHNYPAIIPLGAFQQTPAYILPGPPEQPGLTGEIGFAEVYWANIPRKVVTDGYTLQETKAWARSIVSRISVMAAARERAGKGESGPLRKVDFVQVLEVVEDLVTTISVLEALTFLAKKTQVIDFNLQKLLEDYLDDVQIVADYEVQRQEITGEFKRVIEAVYTAYKHDDIEIYIVAHSEGTVVGFLSLLEAMADSNTPGWLPQVRGLMTIGSPIDKHLILWPGLFKQFEDDTKSKCRYAPAAANRIKWRNYTDYGDPVGFELETARDWMKSYGFDKGFDFTKEDDLLFTRYYVPGKAHTDYWQDADVFGNFIDGVVKTPPVPQPRKLHNRFWARITSYVVAYAIPLALVYASVYVLYKALSRQPASDGLDEAMLQNVALLGGLVAGATVCWRMFNLTRNWFCCLIGTLLFVGTTELFTHFVVMTHQIRWFDVTRRMDGGMSRHAAHYYVFGIVAALMVGLTIAKRVGARTKPGFSQVKLIVMIMGGVLLLNAVIGWYFHHLPRPTLWPLLIGIVAATYLWWLAIMFFDLVFVWHRYIRFGVGLDIVRQGLWKTNEPGKK